MKLLVALFALVTFITGGLSAPEEDLVTELPGLGWTPKFSQFSGFLKAKGTRKLHYWFVESLNDPANDPVVLWLNGGPGCSSLLGFLTEHGPFRIQNDGKTLEPNEFSWNNIANMIYLESPAGVGFSYSDERHYATNDSEVAQNNYLALQDFFRKFPEYKSNEFYITGESYGGIYVPTLASVVLDDSSINLKGFAVGNGLSSWSMNDNSIVYFIEYHGLIGKDDWQDIYNACCPRQNTSSWCDFSAQSKKLKECAKILRGVHTLVWNSGLNVYNLYSRCAGGATDLNLHYDADTGKFITSNFGWPFMFLEDTRKELKEKLSSIPVEQIESKLPCTNDTASVTYLNTADVREALHIPETVQKWTTCSTPVEMGYKTIYQTMEPQYRKAIDKKIRILVYNGDVDMACNFLGDEWFVDSLNLEDPQNRKMWYYIDEEGVKQVAGFSKAYDNFTFVTIRGSGHMVPMDRPRPALDMFINFIKNKPF